MKAKYLVADKKDLNSCDRAWMALEKNHLDMSSIEIRDIFAEKFVEEARKLKDRAKLLEGSDEEPDYDEDEWDDEEDDEEEEGLTYAEVVALPNKSFALALAVFDFDEELKKVISDEDILNLVIGRVIENLVKESSGTFK